jgi:hypothetical protein
MLGTTVRWFASLVVLCLLAGSAGNVRPRVDLRRDAAGDLRMAGGDRALPLVTAARPTRSAPDLRLVSFAIVPAAPAVITPQRALAAVSLAPATLSAPTPGRATSARGPPNARAGFAGPFFVENTVRS